MGRSPAGRSLRGAAAAFRVRSGTRAIRHDCAGSRISLAAARAWLYPGVGGDYHRHAQAIVETAEGQVTMKGKRVHLN
jgi:hypothetical protein